MADTVTLPTQFVVTLYKALVAVEAALDDYQQCSAVDELAALRRDIDRVCGAADTIEVLVSQLTAGLLDAGVAL